MTEIVKYPTHRHCKHTFWSQILCLCAEVTKDIHSKWDLYRSRWSVYCERLCCRREMQILTVYCDSCPDSSCLLASCVDSVTQLKEQCWFNTEQGPISIKLLRSADTVHVRPNVVLHRPQPTFVFGACLTLNWVQVSGEKCFSLLASAQSSPPPPRKLVHTRAPTLPFLWLINQLQIIRKVTPLMITAFLAELFFFNMSYLERMQMRRLTSKWCRVIIQPTVEADGMWQKTKWNVCTQVTVHTTSQNQGPAH